MKQKLIQNARLWFSRKHPSISNDQVNDLLQDATMIYLGKLDELEKIEEPALRSWFIQTMEYLWLNRSKKERRKRSLDMLQENGVDFASVDNDAEQLVVYETLQILLKEISEVEKILFGKIRLRDIHL